MHLVATVQPVPELEAAAGALVEAAGMTAAEARMRLAPEPPAILARLPAERARAVVAALARAATKALAIDDDVPTDTDRFRVRSFALGESGARFTNRGGETLELQWDTVRLVLRGIRSERTTTAHTESRTQFSLGRTVLSGGLVLTKKTSSTVHGHEESAEQFILVHGEAGERVLLSERTLEFTGLGPLLQPARTANLGVLAQELKRHAPRAFHDDRLLRLGRRALPFVVGGDRTVRAGESEVRKQDTRGSVDVLAEVLDRAVREGLLG